MARGNDWLRLTEETNALDYLERAGSFIVDADQDNFAWKWVVLALHGALYGFAIAACKGTNHQNVVTVTKQKKERLVTLDKALEMCGDQEWMGSLHGGLALTLTESQADSISRLKKTLRNNFEHYLPGGWSVELHGLPRISMDVLDVIRFLSIETFRYQHLTARQRKRVKSIVFQSKKRLRANRLYIESHGQN